MLMEISSYTKNNTAYITLIGQLWQKEDINALEEEVTRSLEQEKMQIVIDLQRLSFINSLGLGALVRMHSTIHDTGNRLVLFCIPSNVLEVLEISGFEAFMTIARSEQELDSILAL
ncbi:MAG: STAS domain-containing protein [Fibrobacter sp.]|nr:STAS domain-containing protein [Fibrobacter sp.]